MLVKVSKVFAAFMNETAAKMGFKASAEVVYLSERENCRIFGSWADNLGDYDYRTGKYKAIAVTYPAEYYAVPVYFTSNDLNREFQRRGVSDWAGLQEMIRDLCEI